MKAPLDDYDNFASVVPGKAAPPPMVERPTGIFPAPLPVRRSTGIPMRPPAGSGGVSDRMRPLSLRDMAKRAGG
jgi:hypothetical protein